MARRLRGSGSTSTLVAVSGYATSDDVQRALEAGFDHHLPKPASLDHLHAILAEAARRPGLAGASATP